MKLKLWVLAAVLSQFVLSCKKEFNGQETLSAKYNKVDDLLKNNHHLTIAVVSDIHYMHPSLLVNNGAEGAQDPKLVEFSDPIFRNVLADLKVQRPDILLVPGDLTKDGEKIGHQAMAGFFNELRSSGTKVYVMPGNHDINNAKAKRYDGNNDYPVDMTTKADFETIYGNFGYNNAISRDANSLSYVVQPNAGLRIIAIDASRYEEYGPSGDIAAGRIKPATLTWALAQLAQAKEQHITIFAMMHHNLVEHYAGQTQLDPGYVVEDNVNIANTLMDAGLNIIFTGHYHANDITSYTHNGKELFDIETGSLVTNPSPYRIVTMKENTLDVETKTVQSIAATLPGGLGFIPICFLPSTWMAILIITSPIY
jgi:3',5'-cyclic AMP phosphodiesterase CpdA